MTLIVQLSTLEASGLIRLAQLEPELKYLFRHALIQDAAYQSLLKSDRRTLHHIVGEVLERLYAERLDEFVPLLSHHFVQSGKHRQALRYTRLAAERAIQQYANDEAVIYLTRALDELGRFPDGIERDRLEVIVQTMLGSVYMVTQGEASDLAFLAFSQAIEICERRQMHARAFPVRVGLIGYYLAKAKVADARSIAERAFEFAQHHSSPFLNSWAHWALGSCLYQSGEFASAIQLLEQAAKSPPLPYLVSAIHDARVVSLDFSAHALGLRGYFDQSLSALQRALHLAQELDQPVSLAHVYWCSAIIYQARGDFEETEQWADILIRCSEDYGLKYQKVLGLILQGWVVGVRGDFAHGEAQIRDGLKMLQDLQILTNLPYYLYLLADVCRLSGKIAAGIDVIDQACSLVESSSARFYEAELCRMKGDLLAIQGNDESEKWFQKAIEVARRQQAKALELRATISICRWLAKHNRRQEARQRLAAIWGWFTEGLDTPDWQVAKSLLAEMS